MQIQSAKGTKEYLPEEKIIREQIVRTLTQIFERYGFSPLETPTLQRYDLLAAKYAGGSEILKETFKLKDQGDRDLALRYDLTVPLALLIGQNPVMKMPFKRYEVGKVFRDGPIKAGRLREFWQCDVDVIGPTSMTADAELMLLTLDAFDTLELPVTIEINSRKVLDGLMESLGIPGEKCFDAITAIDKIKKVPIGEIERELAQKGISREKVDGLLRACKAAGTNAQRIAALRKVMRSDIGNAGLKEIEEILKLTETSKGTIEFSPSLARGLAYYTGPVFEAFLKQGEFTSALAGGGRYDEMIGDFLGGNRKIPAVGISFGLEPLSVVLGARAKGKSVAQLYIIPIGTQTESMVIAQQLRAAGMNVDMDLMDRGPSKNLDYARAMGIPFTLFIGQDELKAKKFKLRDMEKGKEELLTIKDIEKKMERVKK